MAITATITLDMIECANCGLIFGLSTDFIERRRKDHDRFYCPRGHSNVFLGKTAEEKQLDQLKKRLADEQEYARSVYAEKQNIEKRLSSTKGQLTKLKNRVSKGVCPCCNRSFTDLHRHMNTQHPEFTAEVGRD